MLSGVHSEYNACLEENVASECSCPRRDDLQDMLSRNQDFSYLASGHCCASSASTTLVSPEASKWARGKGEAMACSSADVLDLAKHVQHQPTLSHMTCTTKDVRMTTKQYSDSYKMIAQSALLDGMGDVYSAHAERRLADAKLTPHCRLPACLSALQFEDNVQLAVLIRNVAFFLHDRFQRFSDVASLDIAITRSHESLQLLPKDHFEYGSSLNAFAAALYTRFQLHNKMEDLEMSAKTVTEALHAHLPGEHSRPSSLYVLSDILFSRYVELGDVEDLESSITCAKEALTSDLLCDVERADTIDRLSRALITRSRRNERGSDVELFLELSMKSLELCPPGHKRHFKSLNAMGRAYWTRFIFSRNMADVDQAITYYIEGLQCCPETHFDRSALLNNLAITLWGRFRERNDISDLDKAIRHSKQALSLHCYPFLEHGKSFEHLALAMLERFHQRGDSADLQGSIFYLEQSLLLRPSSRPDRKNVLNNLALAVEARFDYHGNIADLELVISHYKEIVELSRLWNENCYIALSNLAGAIHHLFDWSGDLADLESALEYHFASLEHCPTDHPDKIIVICSLAITLKARFDHLKDLADLEQCISLLSQVLELRLPDHPDRPGMMTLLSVALRTRFEQFGNMDDLQSALQYQVDALRLLPDAHLFRPKLLTELSIALIVRFTHCGDASDLETAFLRLDAARFSLPSGHPYLHSVYSTYAKAHFARYSSSYSETDREKTFEFHQKAASYPSAALRLRLTSSLQWVELAEKEHHASLSAAYHTSLTLLAGHVMTTPKLSSRRMIHMRVVPPSLASDAASYAIGKGQLEDAVELLEQGRALLWTQLTRFRTPLDSLRALHDKRGEALADRFEALSRLLACGERLSSNESSSNQTAESEAQRYIGLSSEWDTVVQEIRQLEGFSHFLRPTPFSALQTAASDGPIIIVNVSRYRGDAIIVVKEGPPQLVPLKVTLEHVTNLSCAFTAALQVPTNEQSDEEKEDQVVAVLRSLWRLIVSPVVRRLKNIIPRRSRIWWCPTFQTTFLPLHAAGPYEEDKRNLPSIYISSYVPTLSSLISSRRPIVAPAPRRAFCAVGQGEPWGSNSEEDRLIAVDDEVLLISSFVPGSMLFTPISGKAGTREVALEGLHDHNWIHFACHGTQDLSNPYNSSFIMSDGPLTLLDIIQAHLPQPEFAFLSACHTAVGDNKTPDEAIHLAAGMQFSGFRSVIGTIGAVDDKNVLHMVKEFYKDIFDGEPHHTDAAKALNKAMKAVAKKGVPLDQRLVFIHIGA